MEHCYVCRLVRHANISIRLLNGKEHPKYMVSIFSAQKSPPKSPHKSPATRSGMQAQEQTREDILKHDVVPRVMNKKVKSGSTENCKYVYVFPPCHGTNLEYHEKD